MANFCKDCVARLFGPEYPSDFAGLVKRGDYLAVLCESCGPIAVDYEGKKIDAVTFRTAWTQMMKDKATSRHKYGRIDVFTFNNGMALAYYHETEHDENPRHYYFAWDDQGKSVVFEEGMTARVFHVYDTELDYEDMKQRPFFDLT